MPELDLGLVHDPFADPEWRTKLHEDETASPPGKRKSRRGRTGRPE